MLRWCAPKRQQKQQAPGKHQQLEETKPGTYHSTAPMPQALCLRLVQRRALQAAALHGYRCRRRNQKPTMLQRSASNSK